MGEILTTKSPSLSGEEISASLNNEKNEAFDMLWQGVHAALETYSNVHRGSGHNSVVTTQLFEQAREIVLEYLGLNKSSYVVIFCTPRRAEVIKAQLKPGSYQLVLSLDIGLSLGVAAMAVKKSALPKGPATFQSGGGTTRLVSPDWVIWAGAPDRFEAGTPAIINVIAFTRALKLIRQFGNDTFRIGNSKMLTVAEILYHDELEEYNGPELMNRLRQNLIGRDVRVQTREGARPYINLDNGASTPTFEPVWDAFLNTLSQPEQVQQEIIPEVKSIIATILGAPLETYDVIFTSNTTEAINLAAESLSGEYGEGSGTVVLNTILEHNSNELPWRLVPHFSLIRLQVDADGFVDPGEMEDILSAYNEKGQHGKERIRLVAVSGASNVLGVYNNLSEISRIVHHYGARLLVDAAQLVAHRSVEMEQDGIDYLAFSAHKVYAPFGSGALVVRKGLLRFSPEEMELIRYSGEDNTAGIAALGKALVLLQRIGLDLVREEEQALTRRALQGLSQIGAITIYGIRDPDSPVFARKGGVIVFKLKGFMADRVAKQLAGQGGIGTRYGCHCAHLLVKHVLEVSPGLERFQGVMLRLLPGIKLPGLTRISLGIENTNEDIDYLIQTLGKIARKPGKGS